MIRINSEAQGSVGNPQEENWRLRKRYL